MKKNKYIEFIKIINNSILIDKDKVIEIIKDRGYNKNIIDKIGKILLKLDKNNQHKYLDDDVYEFSFNTWFNMFYVYYFLFPEKKKIVILEIISTNDIFKKYKNIIKKDIYKPGILK